MILLIGSGSGKSSLKTKVESLNLAPLHIPKQAEFAVVLGAATPLDLVIMRQRLAEDLREIDQAERELLDLDFVLRRLSPRRAADWKRAATLSWPEGQWLVGACHFEKINGWPQDKTVAACYFQQAVEAGFRKAYSGLAQCYDDGEGVIKNPEKAIELWNAAAVAGDPAAAVVLSQHYSEGRGVPADPIRSLDILRMAADGSNVFARFLLGIRYLGGEGCERNESEAERQFRFAFPVLEKAAHKGGKTAQGAIGSCYLRGWGVQINLPMAVGWLSKSAEQECHWAQKILSDCYADGVGVQADLKKAVELLRSAAIGNYPLAQAILGITLLSGSAGTCDPNEAVEWFRKAAERNDPDGQHQLGRCLIFATGVNENKSEGFSWIQRAAKQGHALAQNDVGYCLLNGIGVQPDPASAIEWFKKSATRTVRTAFAALRAVIAMVQELHKIPIRL